MEKKAFLVYFAPIIRVVASADTDEETIVEMAINKMFKVGIEQFINTDNCDGVEEDIECPYGTFKND